MNVIRFCALTMTSVTLLQVSAFSQDAGPLSITVSGASATSDPNTYVVQLPDSGDAATNIQITGDGNLPDLTDDMNCTCSYNNETTAPDKDGDKVYTFENDSGVGTQDGDGTGPGISWDVTSDTEPGEYAFALQDITQFYKSCVGDWDPGSVEAIQENSQASPTITILVSQVQCNEFNDDQSENMILCNSSSFYNLPRNFYSSNLTISIDPIQREWLIRPDVTMVISKAIPNTTDKGVVFSSAFQNDGSPIVYAAKEETQNMKRADNANLQSQEIDLDLKYKGRISDHGKLTILSIFEYFKNPAADNNAAIEYANQKYAVRYGATYDPLLEDAASTDCITLATTIGPNGMTSENCCASALYHEQVHYNQGVVQLWQMVQGRRLYGIINRLIIVLTYFRPSLCLLP